jgi:S-adenosylmethionine synthetase
MTYPFHRTAEHVSLGHPDKFCDQVADSILDEVLRLTAPYGEESLKAARTAIECLAKDRLLVISGEVNLLDQVRAQLDVDKVARKVWEAVGYGDRSQLTVLDHVQKQSPDIAEGGDEDDDDAGAECGGPGAASDETRPVDEGGAGDQGVMVGYATDETEEFMPREWVLARTLCTTLKDLRESGAIPWLRSDCKTQVTLSAGGEVEGVIIAAQHEDKLNGKKVTRREVCETLLEQVIRPVVGNPSRVVINGTGRFVIGGPIGDAGVVGRKIVVDAYGPRIPVGGGAYSGKDPTKVDRSAAYMCRYIAKTVVVNKLLDARECTVSLAYGIGSLQPQMITAITDSGKDAWPEVVRRFPALADLSPRAIIERLRLLHPSGWSYFQAASYGHYGRTIFPWEQVPGLSH